MPILTPDEARKALRYDTLEEMPEDVVTLLLPGIDESLKTATGKDWSSPPVDPLAKVVARILVVRWHDDPGLIGNLNDAGVVSLITQLEAKALQEQQAEVV